VKAPRWALALTLLAACGPAGTTGPTGATASSAPSAAAAGSAVPEAGTTPVPTSAPAEPPCAWLPCYGAAVDGGTLPDTVREASGVSASGTDPDLYFVVDDGTGSDTIAAVHGNGSVVGLIAVDGMAADNAEALTAGPCPAGRCLFVGDIGGNRGRRTVTVYRLPEPALPMPLSVAAEAWTFTYPDGAFDAEAMLVPDDGGVVVITKPRDHNEPHRVYTGPSGGGDLLLRSTFDLPAGPPRSLLVGNVVTDAARTAESVLLLTYDRAVEFRAPSAGADPAGFPDWEHRLVPTPSQWQSEGITYRSAGGCGYVVVSEKSPMSGPGIGSVPCA
jgi:hypothetical protein